MKIILIAVTSLNGKLTRGSRSNIYSWTSKEDSKLFFSKIKANNLIVMGSKTYATAKSVIKLDSSKLRIVLTRNTKEYKGQEVTGSLEFSSEDPVKLTARLEKLGYKQMLVVGGSEINSLFLKAKLVNEIHLTIEPLLFGSGKNLLSELPLDTKLKLISVKKLNKQGSLNLLYQVVRRK